MIVADGRPPPPSVNNIGNWKHPGAQGTSREWDTAPRGEPATGLMSKWLQDGEIKGFNAPPREDMMKDK